MSSTAGQFITPASDPSRVVGRAVIRAADLLGVRGSVLARVLGLSEASVSRLKTEDYILDPSSKPYELAILFVRLFRGLDAIVGGDGASARSWMTTENSALRDTPISLIGTISGLMQAVQYVDARRARI